MPTSRAAVPLLHLLQHAALLWGCRESVMNAKQDSPRPQHLGSIVIAAHLSLSFMPKQGDKTVSDPLWRACLVEPPSYWCLSSFFLVSLLLRRGGRQGKFTILLPLSHHPLAALNLTYSMQQPTSSSATCSLPQLLPTHTSLATSPPEQPGPPGWLLTHQE